MILIPLLLGFFVLILIVGTSWLLVARGTKTTRSGQDVAREAFESKMRREDRLSGRPALYRKTWVKGTGVAADVNASMSYGEMKAFLLLGQYSKAAPGLMIMTGVLGTMIFAGLTLLFMTPWSIPGIVILGFGTFGTIQCVKWFRKAVPALPAPSIENPPEDPKDSQSS